MEVSWRDIAFQPGRALAIGIAQQWQWLTGREDLSPFLCSMLGDVFATDGEGRVHWLCCPGGHVDMVAQSRGDFDTLTNRAGNERDEWFGPALVKACHDAGKRASPGECYMFKTLPIFPECEYSPANIAVVPVDDVFIQLAQVMQLYEGLPDKQKRRLHLFE